MFAGYLYLFLFLFVCWLILFFVFYVSRKDDNKGLGFGRANYIVTCYRNLSYSLNWSAVDQGNCRRPVVTCRKEVPIRLPPFSGRSVTYPDQLMASRRPSAKPNSLRPMRSLCILIAESL